MTGSPPPPAPDPVLGPPEGGRSTRPTHVALGVLVVVATIVLLIGLGSVLTRGPASGDGPTRSPAASASGSASPPVPPTETVPGSAASPTAVSPTAASPTTGTMQPAAVLVGAGDIGDCATPEDSMTAALLDDIEGTVFTAGDNAYENGSPKDFATCYEATWGRHKARTRPAPGNHDWHTSGLRGYLGYFGDAARGPDGHSWYAYELGTWHIIVLDSECDKVGGCDPDSPQGRWLASDLSTSDARCTLAIWHKPRFSSGEHGNDRSVGPFWTALHRDGVDVVINGHDHDYERFAPQDPAGEEDRAGGIREFVVGTGGTPLRPFQEPKANSELRAAIAHGVFKMTLRDGAYDWEFVPANGDFTDRGTAFCH